MVSFRIILSNLMIMTLMAMGSPAISKDKGTGSASSMSSVPVIEAQSGDDRKPVVRGVLRNGFTYVILPRRGKDASVGILMRVSGGFLAEKRLGERGLAHLIEHLVFLSPTKSAPNDYRRFRQVGFPITLPEPAGGTTSWRESDYFIVSKTNKPEDLDSLAGLFREVVEHLTFRADAVENARSDVLREMADKKLGNDTFANYVAAVAPGSPNDLIDAQNSDDVPTAEINTIRAIYHRIYRPENTMFVIVGDVDASATVRMLQERFGNWQGVGPAATQKAIADLDLKSAALTSYSALPYGRNTALLTSTAKMDMPPRTRKDQMTTSFKDMIAMRAVNARMAGQYSDYPEGKFGFFIDDGAQGYRQMMFWDDFVPGRWREAATKLLQLNCSITTIGFSEEEVRQATEAVLGDLSNRSATVADAPNSWLAKELADATTAKRDLVPPSEMVEFAKTIASKTTAADLNLLWRNRWSAGRHHLRVESPGFAVSKDARGEIQTAVNSSELAKSCKL
jgi:Peptidase M16 inactive domain/Insulinase (Peptidase family M16)